MSESDKFLRTESANHITLEELDLLLKKHNIPIDTWGSGNAKNFEALFFEIQSGECTIAVENGELIRSTNALAINVYCRIDGKTFRLKEEKQVFADGRVRRRGADIMDTSMGEKITGSESQPRALRRALEEELNLPKGSDFVYEQEKSIVKERPSNSYPGLKSRHNLFRYDVLMPQNTFDSDAEIIEKQDDKWTYFIWVEVSEIPGALKNKGA